MVTEFRLTTPPPSFFAGIFMIAASTLLLQISMTRIFSVLFFHHFAFLIVSTALFGYGFSGIYLFYSRSQQDADLSNKLSLASLLFGIFVLVAYKVILILPYGFKATIFQTPVQVLRLALNYAVLAVPFFFSGYVVGTLLRSFPASSGKLYCFDLVGAGLGCLAVLWIVPWLGGSGAVGFSSLLAGLSCLLFRPGKRLLLISGILFCIVAVFVTQKAEQLFAIPIVKVIEEKYPLRGKGTTDPEYTAWSSVSRVDVVRTPPNRLILLDGGSNVSSLVRFNGDYKNLQPRWNWRAVPYAIAQRDSVCIIGPGGGEDVLLALSHGVNSTTAVELDPLIVDLVQHSYKDFIGGIYNHPSVLTVNDEGRSYLRRSDQQYDLIQQVHNISPMAVATGALNLSESYLLTREAFHEYWQHLKPDGVLAINRWGILRAASIASTVLKQKGINNPESYVIVTSRAKSGADTSFYLKKGEITQEDLQKLKALLDEMRIRIDYAPLPEFQRKENAYYRLLVPSLRDDFIQTADIVLNASTDDQPFFDHFQKLGSFRTKTTVLPGELNRVLQYTNLGDLALFTLLAEAVFLSFLFILLPLFRLHKLQKSISQFAVLVYFASLGLGFILIEISLIQKYILFLGQPVYSISSVLFSLLISAGTGSFFFQKRCREGREHRWLNVLALLLTAFLILQVTVVPWLLDTLLGLSQVSRFLLSTLLIAPLGFILGIPFPLGIRILGKYAPELIPWGWGLNAYLTVIGSILCVILAITLGFRMNFLIALLVYLTGIFLFSYKVSQKTPGLVQPEGN
jgi:spermidine synthase